MSSKCVRLQTAAFKGDWEYVKLQNYPQEKLTSKITDKGETALHISAAAGKFLFVESLVNHLKGASQFLETENDTGNTALLYAAVSGDVSIAKVMLDAHAKEAVVRAGNGYNQLANCGKGKPLLMAALLGRCEMVTYLMGETEIEAWSGEERVELFTNCINIGLCGEALTMLHKYKDLATARNKDNDETGLLVLARNPCVFVPQNRPSWRTYIGLCDDNNENSISEAIELVKELYLLPIKNPDLEEADRVKEVARALFVAAKKGNADFIIELIRLDPDLMWKQSKNETIFHIAIQNRHEDIFKLLSELGSFQDLIASIVVRGDRNMLHLAAELAPQEQLDKVSGAALQMQRELLWFKEVEKIVRPSYREMVNSKGKTPHTLFTERHKALMAEGEKWMKETAKSSMVVAALIATVMFTTAFTVPGGYNNNSGEPILENKKSFFIFSVADALALFCSSTSILMFHSILTSRYTEIDFLESLPFRLMVGVTALFVSVAAMMVAFCATFFLYYPRDDVPWMFVLSAIFACVPSMYVSLKYPLLLDLVRSTHASKFMFQSQTQLLFTDHL